MPLNSITRKLHNMPSNSKLLFFFYDVRMFS